MDAKTLGKKIAQLRKDAGLTQVELAEKLMVSDKAVSKWEVGGCFPDMEQIQNLTKTFGVTYDELLGDKPVVKKERIKPKKAKNVQLSKDDWYKLDNAAKVFPTEIGGKGSSVFRVSAVVNEEIDPKILQQALEDLVVRFPTMMVTLKKGLFWYYFEPVYILPSVKTDTRYPMHYFRLNKEGYLFRVLYYKNRVAVEVFHSITDGTGAVIFLNSLLARYYTLKHGRITEYVNCKNSDDYPSETETEDSFIRYFNKSKKARRKYAPSYHFDGKPLKKGRNVVTHFIVNTGDVLKAAHAHNATVTELITAYIAKTILERRAFTKRMKRNAVIQVPVNLRKIFPSESLRNFAYFANVTVPPVVENTDIDSLVGLVKTQLAGQLTEKSLQANINTNVNSEKMFIMRILPMELKKIGLNIAKVFLGDRMSTMSFSNLGRQQCPAELDDFIDRYEFTLHAGKTGGIAVSMISHNDKAVLTVSRSIKESYFEKAMAQMFCENGIEVRVESNIGDNYEEM